MGLVVELKAVSGPLVVVHRELSRGGDDQDAGTLLRGEMSLPENLNGRYHISECFSRARLGRTEDISSVQYVWNSSCLDLGRCLEPELLNGLERLLEQGKIRKLDLREVLYSRWLVIGS